MYFYCGSYKCVLFLEYVGIVDREVEEMGPLLSKCVSAPVFELIVVFECFNFGVGDVKEEYSSSVVVFCFAAVYVLYVSVSFL